METLIAAVPSPVGAWDFNNPQNLLQVTIGRNPRLQGQPTATAGARTGDGAVRSGVGSHYVCDHAIAPQSPASFVNRFSLLYDLRFPALGPWYCLFQTAPLNENDGDCFIRAGSGTVGVGATGYSSTAVTAGQWQRLIVAVDHFAATHRIHLDFPHLRHAGNVDDPRPAAGRRGRGGGLDGHPNRRGYRPGVG